MDGAAGSWAADTAGGEEAFQAWLSGDPRSRGALLRAQALSMISESAQALGAGFDPAAFEEPRPSRSDARCPAARP